MRENETPRGLKLILTHMTSLVPNSGLEAISMTFSPLKSHSLGIIRFILSVNGGNLKLVTLNEQVLRVLAHHQFVYFYL